VWRRITLNNIKNADIPTIVWTHTIPLYWNIFSFGGSDLHADYGYNLQLFESRKNIPYKTTRYPIRSISEWYAEARPVIVYYYWTQCNTSNINVVSYAVYPCANEIESKPIFTNDLCRNVFAVYRYEMECWRLFGYGYTETFSNGNSMEGKCDVPMGFSPPILIAQSTFYSKTY
jgi:hypothetical protein